MTTGDRRAAFRRLRRHFERLLELGDEARANELERLARAAPALAAELAALLAAAAAPEGPLDGTASRFLDLLAPPPEESD